MQWSPNSEPFFCTNYFIGIIEVISIFKMNSALSKSFSRAAKTYSDSAVAQSSFADSLVTLVKHITYPRKIFEIGCGSGVMTEMLAKAFPGASILAADISSEMVNVARERLGNNPNVTFEVADLEKLVPAEYFDLIISNAMLHWVDDVHGLIEHLAPTIRRGGYFACASMIPGTLRELEKSRAISAPNKYSPWPYHSTGKLLEAVRLSNLSLVDAYKIDYSVEYPLAKDVISSLRNTGVTNWPSNKERSPLLSRSEVRSLPQNYPQNNKGAYTASYRSAVVVARQEY